jgi:hypothetical protein
LFGRLNQAFVRLTGPVELLRISLGCGRFWTAVTTQQVDKLVRTRPTFATIDGFFDTSDTF